MVEDAAAACVELCSLNNQLCEQKFMQFNLFCCPFIARCCGHFHRASLTVTAQNMQHGHSEERQNMAHFLLLKFNRTIKSRD